MGTGLCFEVVRTTRSRVGPSALLEERGIAGGVGSVDDHPMVSLRASVLPDSSPDLSVSGSQRLRECGLGVREIPRRIERILSTVPRQLRRCHLSFDPVGDDADLVHQRS